MQQDNNLNDKLQQLENQQLPDLSQMDKHWEQMRSSLEPAAAKPGITFLKPLIWIIAAACIFGSLALLHHHFSSKEDKTFVVPDEQKLMASKEDPFHDTTINKKPAAVVNAPGSKKNQPYVVLKNKIAPINNKRAIPITDTANKTKTVLQNLPVEENTTDQRALLNMLFSQLEKTPQDFLINNSADTLLECTGGSGLLIPANSLGGGAIKITVTEFYKKSDIVANKLTTTSNAIRLESGGMLHIIATKDGKLIKKVLDKPIKFYVADTSAVMQTMQLFTGEENKKGSGHQQTMDTLPSISYDGVNWIAQSQYFRQTVTEVKVLDLRNEPFKTIKKRKGVIAVFNLASNPALSRSELKTILKQKYGYYKVRFGFRENSFFHGKMRSKIDSIVYSDIPVGDSVWMLKSKADRYRLTATDSRTYQLTNRINFRNEDIIFRNPAIADKIRDRYSVDINALGWINCDRYSNDTREKINYVIDLKDWSGNYYTVMVFEKSRSVIGGMTNGRKVLFANMPVGEPVKLISIGIDKNGQSIMAMKQTVIEKAILTGLQFEPTSVTAIKTSLGNLDQ